MLEDHDLIEGSVQKNVRQNAEASLELVASELAQQLDKCAILLDIDGTLVDLARSGCRRDWRKR
jgi:trehalose-6-phosphatase